MNPVSNGPHSRKVVDALSKLKWLVVAENFEQETAAFWRDDILALAGKKPEDVQTEVFMLPAANFAEKDGSFVNSARWIQWKWKAVDPPGDALPDQEIVARLFLAVRALYEKEGGTYPEPVRALNWWYANPARPSLDDVAREINGWAIEDVRDSAGTVTLRAGQQLSRATDARADGTTLSGNWLYIGMYTDAGNLTQRRSFADVSGLGRYSDWAYSWPANRRILYNRCSADAKGQPWDASRPSVAWNGQRWTGDVPEYTPDSVPDARRRCTPVRSWSVRRRPVVRALRAGRVTGAQSAPSVAKRQSGRQEVHHRVRRARHRGRISDRVHDVPIDRALPLLDEKQPVRCAAAAGVLRGDSRGAGSAEGHCQRRSRACDLGARID
jgi:anaerobic selenocysteine-containing dehydrogenase